MSVSPLITSPHQNSNAQLLINHSVTQGQDISSWRVASLYYLVQAAWAPLPVGIINERLEKSDRQFVNKMGECLQWKLSENKKVNTVIETFAIGTLVLGIVISHNFVSNNCNFKI